jgi:hypothetical protein
MKKSTKLMGAMRVIAIIAVAAIIGLSMSACEDVKPQTEVTINGIEGFNGKLAVVSFFSAGTYMGQAAGNINNSGKFNGFVEKSGDPVELKKGPHNVNLYIANNVSDMNDDKYLYSGYVSRQVTDTASFTVEFSAFIKVGN